MTGVVAGDLSSAPQRSSVSLAISVTSNRPNGLRCAENAVYLLDVTMPRIPALPDIPTIAQAGVPAFEITRSKRDRWAAVVVKASGAKLQ